MPATLMEELHDPKENIQVHLKEDVTAIETETAFSTSNFHPEIFAPLFLYEIPENVEEDFSQIYFWTDEWQEIEYHSDEDISMGRVELFDSIDDLITELNS